MSPDLDLRDDLNMPLRGILDKLLDRVASKRVRARQLGVRLEQDRCTLIVSEVHEQGVHPVLRHEVDQPPVVLVLLPQPPEIDHYAPHAYLRLVDILQLHALDMISACDDAGNDDFNGGA